MPLSSAASRPSLTAGCRALQRHWAESRLVPLEGCAHNQQLCLGHQRDRDPLLQRKKEFLGSVWKGLHCIGARVDVLVLKL